MMQFFDDLTRMLSETNFYQNYMKFWPEPLNDASFDVFLFLLFACLVVVPEIASKVHGFLGYKVLEKRRKKYVEVAKKSREEKNKPSEDMELMDQYLKFMLVANFLDKGIDVSFEEWKEAKFGDSDVIADKSSADADISQGVKDSQGDKNGKGLFRRIITNMPKLRIKGMFENGGKKGAEDISHESIRKLDKEVKEVIKENVLDSNGICEEVDAALVYEKALDGELGEIGTMLEAVSGVPKSESDQSIEAEAGEVTEDKAPGMADIIEFELSDDSGKDKSIGMDVVDEFEQILSSLEQKRGEMRQFKENEEFKESSQQQMRKALDEKFSFDEDDESYSDNECKEDARVYDAKAVAIKLKEKELQRQKKARERKKKRMEFMEKRTGKKVSGEVI